MSDRNSPLSGANRREGLLLAAYVLLFVIGVWTVAAAELDTQEPGSLHLDNVGQATENAAPAGK